MNTLVDSAARLLVDTRALVRLPGFASGFMASLEKAGRINAYPDRSQRQTEAALIETVDDAIVLAVTAPMVDLMMHSARELLSSGTPATATAIDLSGFESLVGQRPVLAVFERDAFTSFVMQPRGYVQGTAAKMAEYADMLTDLSIGEVNHSACLFWGQPAVGDQPAAWVWMLFTRIDGRVLPMDMASSLNLLHDIERKEPLGEEHAIDWWDWMNLLSLMMLSGQKITTTERLRPSRGLFRRAERAGEKVPDEVSVITLRRRVGADGASIGAEAVEWSHRWLVSGHWRNQWMPSTDGHQLRWIDGYVKGPEDKPLVLKTKRFVWTR